MNSYINGQVKAYGGGQKCWNNLGSCRKQCKDGEVIQKMCKTHRVCCVPPNRVKVQLSTSPTPLYDLATGVIDIILTLKPYVTSFKVNTEEEEDEETDLTLGTQISVPEVHRST
ncbi:beta-defensin 118 isoform X2 [Tupaia chinensis]|uniref:beta-defensin 118 isoform X2 n=1 Tax=Tupaia chinensis TaxID=246437 RepID=UPI0003C8E214|nr:beta-defensin 118 isoform X2 [Tupaia chinensis]